MKSITYAALVSGDLRLLHACLKEDVRRILSQRGAVKCVEIDCDHQSTEQVVVGSRLVEYPGCCHPRNETGALDPCPMLETEERP